MAKKADRKGYALQLEEHVDDRGRRFWLKMIFGDIDGRYELIEVTISTGVLKEESGDVLPLQPMHQYATTPVERNGVQTWEEIDPPTPPFGILAEDLRQAIPWGGIIGDLRKRYAAQTISIHGADGPGVSAEVDRWRSRDRTDRLATVADVYRRAVRIGDNPIDAICRELDVPSKSTASKMVMRARRAGHLPPTSKGKAAV